MTITEFEKTVINFEKRKKLNPTYQDFIDHVNKFPELGASGFWTNDHWEKYGSSCKKEHQELLNDVSYNEYLRCLVWLRNCVLMKSFDDSDSYWYKHIVEAVEPGYVCAGSFIAAALFLEIPFRIIGSQVQLKINKLHSLRTFNWNDSDKKRIARIKTEQGNIVHNSGGTLYSKPIRPSKPVKPCTK